MKLWIGQTVSEIGSRITREGIPLTAVMLSQASPAQMGILASLTGFAALLFGPLAGYLADRWRLRPILVAADLGRAALLSLIPLLHTQGNLNMFTLYAVMACTAVCTTFFDVAYQSLLPSLVKPDQLLEDNANLTMSQTTAELLGPATTGLLVQWLSAPRAIALDALSFVVSALSILAIRTPEAAKQLDQPPSWRELSAGFRYTFHDPLLRAMALRSATAFFFFGFFSTLYVLYAVQVLGFTPIVLGVIVAMGGAGAFLGAAFAERVANRLTVGTAMIGATIVAGALQLLIAAAPGPGWMAMVCLGAAQLIGDFSYPVYGIHETTLRQTVTPPELLGRVNACAQLLWKGAWPIGALAGGWLAAAIGMRATFMLCAAGVIGSSLWLVFSPVRRLRNHQLV